MQLNTWKFFLLEKCFHLRIFYTRKTFYYICCISCFAVASFIIFALSVVLLWHLLSYLLYQLFCRGIFYYICCISCFVVPSFIIFVVSVVLLWHLLSYFLYQLFCSGTICYFCWDTHSAIALLPPVCVLEMPRLHTI